MVQFIHLLKIINVDDFNIGNNVDELTFTAIDTANNVSTRNVTFL